MKTFTVEGRHWLKDVEVDESLFDNYADESFEAMTQGIEGFFNGEFEEEYDGEPSLGLFLIAYERGQGEDEDKRTMGLTEYILYNAGYHAIGDEFRKLAEDELGRENKKRKKKS
jgi:hypothetical protein